VTLETGTGRNPLVTIAMPLYNDARYVGRALDDLLAQSFTDFELIISDNASTDGGSDIAQAYAARDARIRYIRQPENLGPIENFLFLHREAAADFFFWAASDDRWDSEFVANLVSALRADESSAAAFCAFQYCDENDEPLGTKRSFDFSGSTPLARLAKFFLTFDSGADAFWYGMFRKSAMDGFRIRRWWGINRKTPMNIAYPVLGYFLSRGTYIHASDRPLWRNRIHINSPPRYLARLGVHPVAEIAAQILRRVNMAVFCLVEVHRARRSLVLTSAIAPVIMVRCARDIFVDVRQAVRYITRRMFRAA
jgi:glycosyltransferase involved in cell wall biosynthesis